MKKVLIINQAKSDNIGDKAIGLALEKFYLSRNYLVDMSGYTQTQNIYIEEQSLKKYKATKKYNVPVIIRWFIKEKRKIKNEMKKYNNNYDLIIIGGGQLVKSNCYFPFAFNYWSKFSQKHSKKCIVVGVGFDTNLNWFEKKLIEKSFKHINDIIVRDDISFNYITNNFNVKCYKEIDVAFLLYNFIENFNFDHKKKHATLIMIYDYSTYRYHFKNNMSNIEYWNYWEKILLSELNKGYTVFLGYTTLEDKIETINFSKYIRDKINKNLPILKNNTVEELLLNISMVDKVITARMHALILSSLMDKISIPIVISSKISQYKKEYMCDNLNIEDKIKCLEKKLIMLSEK